MSIKVMGAVVVAGATVLTLFGAQAYDMAGSAAVAQTSPALARHVFESIPQHHGLASGSASSCPAISQGVSPRPTLPAKAVIRT